MPQISSGMPQNEPTPKGVNTHSNFPLGAPFYGTYRFGEYAPIFATETTEGDKFSVRSSHDLRTYTLAQPLMSNIQIKKDWFFVPAECILPLNWDKVYVNPNHGQDVNVGFVGCSVQDFASHLLTFFSDACSRLSSFVSDMKEGESFADYAGLSVFSSIKLLLMMESIYSNGSLLAALGAHYNGLFIGAKSTDYEGLSFDKYFQEWFSDLSKVVKSLTLSEWYSDDSSRTVHFDNIPELRAFLDDLRDDIGRSFADGVSIEYQAGKDDEDLTSDFLSHSGATISGLDEPLNLARLWAYQIVCAHYFTNDRIDYIYDANLFRQNVQDAIAAINYVTQGSKTSTFILNGSEFQYDALCAFYFLEALSYLDDLVPADIEEYESGLSTIGNYWRLLFGYNRSLRFVDYFTGSKSQPLAVGDVNVAVNAGKVNVIDVTQNIQKQRFLNAVNRAGRRLSEYVKGIFGVSQAPDYHNPFWLGHTSDVIGNQEVENTGARQFDDEYGNSVTTILRGNSSNFAFETDFDRVGILIGMMYFDIPRAYCRGVDRLMTHVDRYDMFNPFMQYIGDQAVYQSERDVANGVGTFAYQLRHMEYKQRYPTAFGGFVEDLPGYCFLADESEVDPSQVKYVSPSFIRSKPVELDKFYLSLKGLSLASYFHFIVKSDFDVEARRPMAYAPSIL